MKYPKSIQNLINELIKIPTVGPKTAERYVFYLLKQNHKNLKQLADAIENLKNNINICKFCFSVSETDICEVCSNPNRDRHIICVVANTRDKISIENTKYFNGYYHILGGVINTIENIRPEDLKINELIDKIKKDNIINEIILALSPDMEGETTSIYLTKKLKPLKIKITRLAKGLPSGSNLEYADELTLSNALKYRNTL